LLAAGFFAALITALYGGTLFYSPFILVCTGVLIVFVIIRLFRLVGPKWYKRLVLSFLALCVLSAGALKSTGLTKTALPESTSRV
jgi:uncharacterized membrane protein